MVTDTMGQYEESERPWKSERDVSIKKIFLLGTQGTLKRRNQKEYKSIRTHGNGRPQGNKAL